MKTPIITLLVCLAGAAASFGGTATKKTHDVYNREIAAYLQKHIKDVSIASGTVFIKSDGDVYIIVTHKNKIADLPGNFALKTNDCFNGSFREKDLATTTFWLKDIHKDHITILYRVNQPKDHVLHMDEGTVNLSNSAA